MATEGDTREGKIFKVTWGWRQADGTVGRLEFCIWVGTEG